MDVCDVQWMLVGQWMLASSMDVATSQWMLSDMCGRGKYSASTSHRSTLRSAGRCCAPGMRSRRRFHRCNTRPRECSLGARWDLCIAITDAPSAHPSFTIHRSAALTAATSKFCCWLPLGRWGCAGAISVCLGPHACAVRLSRWLTTIAQNAFVLRARTIRQYSEATRCSVLVCTTAPIQSTRRPRLNASRATICHALTAERRFQRRSTGGR